MAAVTLHLRSACVLGIAASLAALRAQAPAPLGEADSVAQMLAVGLQALQTEDPVLSWQTFQDVALAAPERPDGAVGLGRAHLLMGRAATARAYADCVLARDPVHQEAMTLAVRARIRARDFDTAMRCAAAFVARVDVVDAELLAAQASALFRVQRTEEAAAVYQKVLLRDARHAEAHLRLGSGLSEPREVAIGPQFERSVAAMRGGRLDDAMAELLAILASDPGNPVAHRLLGEALLQQRALASMALRDAAFAQLRAAWPVPDVASLPIAEFVPAYPLLDGPRREVVDRAMSLFGRRLPKLLAIGGRHDLLLETERTTDASARSMLRGRRTFDGRVWDDVRGIGGLSAATGIEALDEAAQFGFDTLVHEFAHQVHFFALLPVDRARIRALYQAARTAGRCLDYYAATNEAEYFGQGVEAFVSLAKRPGGETTHGHTRFELWQVDRELHDFIAGLVDHDPLAGPGRERLLLDAMQVALRSGRPEDAAAAAAMLPPGRARDRAVATAAAAVRAAQSL